MGWPSQTWTVWQPWRELTLPPTSVVQQLPQNCTNLSILKKNAAMSQDCYKYRRSNTLGSNHTAECFFYSPDLRRTALLRLVTVLVCSTCHSRCSWSHSESERQNIHQSELSASNKNNDVLLRSHWFCLSSQLSLKFRITKISSLSRFESRVQ